MRLFFLLMERVQPVMSPVVARAFEILRRRGYRIESGIAERMLHRCDELRPAHDLYLLKSHTELSLSLVGVLHSQGARILNPYPSCAIAQNKIMASRILRAAGIPAPDCWATGDFRLLADVVRQRPLILKPHNGYHGAGVTIVRDRDALERVAPANTPMLAQEYIPGGGEDLKVYVAGNEVFAVRKPFSPTSHSVPGRPCEVSPEVRDIALRCGRVLNLGLYGLDMIENDNGVWVVDVNYFPGYKGVPDAGDLIADYIDRYASEAWAAPLGSLLPAGGEVTCVLG